MGKPEASLSLARNVAVDRIDREDVVSPRLNADGDDGMVGQAMATLLDDAARGVDHGVTLGES